MRRRELGLWSCSGRQSMWGSVWSLLWSHVSNPWAPASLAGRESESEAEDRWFEAKQVIGLYCPPVTVDRPAAVGRPPGAL